MLPSKRKWPRFRPLLGAIELAVLALSVFGGHAFAGVYGRGDYSGCSYQQQCAEAPTETTTTMPSGLQVSVNLGNGQVIPRDGYTVMITPLNSSTINAAIQQVEIYLDGVLVATLQPEETGTAKWEWKPTDLPAKEIKLVITGTDGSVITDVFSVTIESAAAEQQRHDADNGTTEKNGDTTGFAAAIQQVYNGTKQFVGKLPKHIVYGFPYVLFLLLGINVAVLLWQAAKELREYHIWLGFLNRERLQAEEKRTLLQLIAHYLRTPLTVLKGGIEMIAAPADGAVSKALGEIAQRLEGGIEQLLARTAQAVSGAETMVTDKGVVRVFRPGLVVPLVLVAAIVLPFDYLVNEAGKLSVSQVNMATQVIVFGLLAILTYVVYRRILLGRRKAAEAKYVYEQEQELRRASDGLLDGVANTLRADITELDRLAAQVPANSIAAKYIVDSTQRFKQLSTKMTLAERLSHAQPGATFTSVALDSVVKEAFKDLSTKVAEHGVNIERPAPLNFEVRSPELASYVLQTVLDNAIAYSFKGGAVRIQAAQDATSTTITISDSGAGIPSEKQPLLFEPFSRTEKVEDFTHEGMGFSLYLDALIMKYLGGEIKLESAVGRGTKVALTFPRKAA